MLTNYISNIIMFIFLISLVGMISGIIVKDCGAMTKHLKYCEEYCYPGVVVEQFSRNTCVCQTEVELKYPLDKQ